MKSFFAEGPILNYNLLNYRSLASYGFNKKIDSQLFHPLGSGKRKALQAVDLTKRWPPEGALHYRLK